mmetsp:Transcript_29750/g.79043  ORF Transcript_29750/g.79043 Transcript_29750/m.79043 type:complete len:215 (-) Transcript_29750:246-890(-)
MPPRVRRVETPVYIEDETPEFIAALRKCDTTTVNAMLLAVSTEDAAAWIREPLDDDGWTALHHVLSSPREGQLGLVRLLTKHGADANTGTVDGVTPLHLGAQHGSKYVIRALLCAGGDNLRRAKDGRTTVDFAQWNPAGLEAYDVVGWPGEGPRPRPLDRRTLHTTDVAKGVQSVPGTVTVTEGTSPSLSLWLSVAAVWFSIVALLSSYVIQRF